MKISIKIISLFLSLPLALTACGGDDDDLGGGGSNTANANANGTEKSVYATRIEVPRLKNGNNYLFLAKTSTDLKDGVNYILEWDCMNRAQRWVCWMWDKTNSYKGFNRDKWRSGETFNGYGGNADPFQPDPDFQTAELHDLIEYRSTLADYSGSGYNRGHMCASEDRICSKEVNGQTFYLTNMHPQISEHNTGIWSTLESKVRTWRDNTVNASGTMYVCKGGTIGDVKLDGSTQKGVSKRISGTSQYELDSNKGIPVPKYFYMAILKKSASGLYSGVAFWTEHKAYNAYEYSDFSKFMITINELEERTGIDFFCNLPDNIEESVESSLTQSEWK